jgi:hypothetical protein
VRHSTAVRLFASSVAFTAFALTSSLASAHIALDAPTPRYADLKEGPCGRGTADARTKNVTTFKAGETITVKWHETIGHPGHYRIAFDDDGVDGFKDPKSFDDVSGGPSVLVDGIADKAGNGTYSQDVTLPNVECNNCTLQVIQVMTDKPPYGDGNDIYYQCADIVLVKDASAADAGGSSSGATATQPPSSGGGDGGGCSSAPGRAGSTEAALIFAAGAVVIARLTARRSGSSSRSRTRGTPTSRPSGST